jgi:hypothetical protein
MLKAYHVRDSEGGHQEIVFAETSGKAKMRSDALGWCDFTDIRAKRVKEFDQYTELGVVPKQIMLENGWWFECNRCLTYVDIDNDAKVSKKNDVYCESCFNKL